MSLMRMHINVNKYTYAHMHTHSPAVFYTVGSHLLSLWPGYLSLFEHHLRTSESPLVHAVEW